MNKIEASQLLGIGVRSLERHTSEGRVAAQKVKGKTGPTLDYDRAELERFKAELEAPPPVPQAPPSAAMARLPQQDATVRRKSDLTALQGAFGGTMNKEAAMQFAAVLDAVEAHRSPRATLADKLLLTLTEAQALTGLSRGVLRAAIESGELKARQIGRAWRIKRPDLESYIKKL
jgi:excisionase family DNA binding protein